MKMCPVCRGNKIIRLPLYQQATGAWLPDDMPPPSSASYKDFPCPECSDVVPEARVALVAASMTIDERYATDKRAMEHVKASAVSILARTLYEGGFVRFARSNVDPRTQLSKLVAEVGVVSQAQVTNMEERISARQRSFGRRVAKEACERIRNFGRDVGWNNIHKDDATRIIYGAAEETPIAPAAPLENS